MTEGELEGQLYFRHKIPGAYGEVLGETEGPCGIAGEPYRGYYQERH